MKKILVMLAILFLLIPQTVSSWTVTGSGDQTECRTITHTSSAFDGATTNAHGSIGEKPTYTVWTVTGVIHIVAIGGVVGTNLAGTGEAQIGTATNLVLFLAQTEAVNIDAGEAWAATADPVDSTDKYIAVFQEAVINNGEDIIETTTTADITSGQIDYYMIWCPLSSGASVVEAGTLS